MHHNIKSLFGNAGILAFGSGFVAILGFFQSVVVARTLGPSEFGIWAIIVSFSAMTNAFLSFRTAEPLTRNLVQFKKENAITKLKNILGTAIVVDLITGLLAFSFILVASGIVAENVSGGINAREIYIIYGATALFNFFDASWLSVLRDQKRIVMLAAIPLALSVLRFSGIVVIAGIGELNLKNLALWMLIVYVLQLIIKIVTINSQMIRAYSFSILDISWSNVLKKNEDNKGFWRFMKFTYLSSSFTSVAKNADVFFLGMFRSDAEVGLYRIAKGLVSTIQVFTVSIGSILYHDANEMLVSGRLKELRSLIIHLFYICTPVVVILVLIGQLIGEDVIVLFYSESFRGSFPPFSILMFCFGVVMILFWAQPLILAMDEFKYNTLVLVGGSILIVALMPVFARDGIEAMAWLVGIVWAFIYVFLAAKVTRRLGQ